MPSQTIGVQIRQWRRYRRLSQLDCALEADISQRHLSFIESGRASPSREMVLHLSDRLEIPLRDRNAMLLAAGFAPQFRERPIDDPAMAPARQAVELILKGHEPYPALAVDRHWTLVSTNAALAPLLAGVADPSLLKPPVNVLRLSLHPAGLAPYILNLGEWRKHLLERLRRQIAITGDPVLSRLLGELSAYPAPETHAPARDFADIIVPLELSVAGRRLAFFSTISVFGTAVDIALSELVLECFFPADEATAEALRAGF